jgi:ATP/maltotriose-dependent transcriptional regulator MalT
MIYSLTGTSRGGGRTATAASDTPALPGGLPPLVEAKLLSPRQPSGLVERPRVTNLLDGAEGAALTLLSAPTGYGKTTAVRAWCEVCGDAFAWITLDAGDNDPVRLWTYVATGVNRIREGLARRALQRLNEPAAAVEFAIDELTNGIAAFAKPLVVVLDELQKIDDPVVLTSFEHFIERLPPNARLVALTRSEPAIQLARRRGHGALVELRAAELAFTRAEARELLVERAAIPLGEREVDVVVERTEGWPAGLYLAALWLRGLDDPAAGAREFAGSHRNVVGYLSGEVLHGLDADTRSFLLGSSVLGRFTAELCDAVLRRSDSSAMLTEIERRNLFLVPLDGQGSWFRYHALFAELLALELDVAEPGTAAELHRRARVWLEERGLIVEAAEHAAAAGDHAFVADLLIRHHRPLHLRPATFLRWVETLPEDVLVERPLLPVMAALQAGRAGRPSQDRRRFLALAARARAEHPNRFGSYIEALLALVGVGWIDGDLVEAIRRGREGAALVKGGGDAGPLFVSVLAALSHALYIVGELDEATETARAAVEHPDVPQLQPSYAVALSVLALTAAQQGSVAAARVHVDGAARVIRETGLGTDWVGGIVAAASAVVRREEGNLPQAERDAENAERIRRTQGACVELAWTLVLLADIRRRRGRLVEAQRALEEARDVLGQLADADRIEALLAGEERELADALDRAAGDNLFESLSEAELAVLRQLAGDLSVRQIAAELFLSVNTVKTHTRGIYRKLGVRSRADAVARAGALGLLRESPGVNESPAAASKP